MIKNKLKAFSIHFALSIIVVSFVISLIIYFWYPMEYLGLTRFKQVALLIISVDLVMGPILTFVVYNPNKKSLRFDLAVIAILQFSALSYGVYTLYKEHPVYITFNVDRFSIVQARDAKPEEAKYDEYKVSKLTSAKVAFAKLPEDKKAADELLLSALDGGADLDQRTDYYEPYADNIESILTKGLDPEMIFSEKNLYPESKKFLEKHEGDLNKLVFLPLTGPSKMGIIVLDKSSAKPITTLNVDPWELAMTTIKAPLSKTK